MASAGKLSSQAFVITSGSGTVNIQLVQGSPDGEYDFAGQRRRLAGHRRDAARGGEGGMREGVSRYGPLGAGR